MSRLRTLLIAAALACLAAKRPDLRLSFSPEPGHACELHLTRLPGPNVDYAVTKLIAPHLKPPSAWARLFGGDRRGHAGLFPPVGVWNTFARQDGHLLRAFVRDEWPFSRDILRAIACARDEWPPARVPLAEHALDFVEGRTAGRGYWIDVRARHPADRNVDQTQTLYLLLPESTYPRGVLIAADGSLPTHDYLLNVRWTIDDHAAGAVLLPVEVAEAGAPRPAAYRVGPRGAIELELDDTFVRSEEVE